MDYQNHYDRLIERAKNRKLDCFTEGHLGGPDVPENIVQLTPEEHHVAHQLLVKLHPGHTGLLYAAYLMTIGNDGRKGNKWYGWLKRRYHKACKQRVGPKNGSYGRCWYYNPMTGESGKFLAEDVPVDWVKGRVCRPGAKKPIPGKLDFCRVCGFDIRNLSGRYRQLCDTCLHKLKLENVKKMISRTQRTQRVSDREKKVAVENSKNIRQALILLGLAPKGNNYARLRSLIEHYNWQLGKNVFS